MFFPIGPYNDDHLCVFWWVRTEFSIVVSTILFFVFGFLLPKVYWQQATYCQQCTASRLPTVNSVLPVGYLLSTVYCPQATCCKQCTASRLTTVNSVLPLGYLLPTVYCPQATYCQQCTDSSLPPSLPNALPCFQPSFTRRTCGLCLRTLFAVRISLSFL